jgi:hypothetical protein
MDRLKSRLFLEILRWHPAWNLPARAAGAAIQGETDMTLIQRAMGATLGVAALASTVACGARDSSVAAAPVAGTIAASQAVAPAQPSALPVVVTCEPNQRTLVRPVVVNGAALSQVECVSIGAAPVAASGYAPAAVRQVSYEPLPETRVVRSEAPARVVPARQVVYRDEVPVRRPKRSVAKSAVIIGTTAGASAGIGALIGGKKGALIGAAVGGGGATLWDQITRRK